MEQNTGNEKRVGQNDAVMGLSGVGAVIVLILIIVLILNYLNILALSQLFPSYFGFLPHMSSRESGNNVANIPDKNTFVSPKDAIVASVKDNFGYDILWIANDDAVGRTVLYLNNKSMFYQQTSGSLNGVGDHTNAAIGKVDYTVGIFDSFQDIKDSKDKYLVLTDPISNKRIQSVKVFLSDKYKTRVKVEDLSAGPKKLGPDGTEYYEYLGFLEDYINNDKFINKGDAVGVVLDQSLKTGERDAAYLFIRRFGGKKQVEKELGKNP